MEKNIRITKKSLEAYSPKCTKISQKYFKFLHEIEIFG